MSDDKFTFSDCMQGVELVHLYLGLTRHSGPFMSGQLCRAKEKWGTLKEEVSQVMVFLRLLDIRNSGDLKTLEEFKAETSTVFYAGMDEFAVVIANHPQRPLLCIVPLTMLEPISRELDEEICAILKKGTAK